MRIEWKRLGGGGLVSGALIFAGLLVMLTIREGQFQPIHRLLMTVTAAGMVYFVIARRINVTQLAVNDESITVRHGPLPLRARVVAPLTLVAGVRCDAHGRRLMLRTHQGEDVILLEDVPPRLLEESGAAIVSNLGLPLV